MEDTVQVMASGRKIDRITRPLHSSGSTPTIIYRRRIWPVMDSCIHIDGTSEPPVTSEASHPDAWMQLVARLLPHPLPTDQGECAEQLRADFRDHLPDSTIRAISLLVSLGHEAEARELLVDFLEQIRPPERVKRLVELLLLFRRSAPPAPTTGSDLPAMNNTERPTASPEPELDGSELLTLTWLPEPESQIPSIDDTPLRSEARTTQEGIGAHVIQESGLVIEGLNEMPDEQDWKITAPIDEPSKRPAGEEDHILLQRTLDLGSTALDVLRYFANNPGDRALHAEQVLGYSLPVVNSLLSGKLSHYVQRSTSGGWACQSWVPNILAVLDSES
ncbi:hypothetical protein [Pseudomonas aeruginosa]|uniref:hypothetical protein n=1 Tax=Pseudomonas aeruginosa TaxID=287 RepID=UPI001A33E426|nr:hypothetical protein [Pseudomonas aeruginosa]MBG7441576.1 hypothetical protein [Pseudomonas aeruginosa]MDU0512588.1 hypothetical protein [Pseudomonas aeruginosa]HED8873730.1 hypothetical protein [Pseudomonas aeruginosa]